MLNKKIPREIKIQEFENILYRIKKTKGAIPLIKLFGGEPTLHSKFLTLINIALEKFNFPCVFIFTNAIFNERKIDKIRKYFPKLHFIINIQTPGFINNPRIQKLVIERIRKLSIETNVTLSINIYFGIQINKIINLLKRKRLLTNIRHIRLGASNPIANGVNNYSYNKFKEFGQLTMTIIQRLKEIQPSIKITLDCGFTPCMFSTKDKKYIESIFLKKDWGCSMGNIDIDTSLTAFTCYSLSILEPFRLSLKKMSLDKIYKKLTIRQYIYQEKFIPEFCKKCPYYGFSEKRCSGPCLALNINSSGGC